MARELPASVKLKLIDGFTAPIKKIQAQFPNLTRAISRTNTAFTILEKTSERYTKTLKRLGSGMSDVGRSLSLSITAPVAAATAFSVKAFADYETALVGVGKTTNLQGAELETLGEKFLDLSKRIPVSATELLGLGQTAAQLGVTGADNVLKFSETLGKLARASDVAGEEGAAALARFITVTRGSISDVGRYAAALVALGNTSAATESEILQFSLRLGASTAVFNVSGTQALGMATALKSVGIEAEAGSSAVQRAMGEINKAIGAGGQKLEILSKLTGIAAGELKDRFKTDAVGVLRDFAAGLARVEAKGGDVTKALEFFGLTGVRDIQVIGTLSKSVGLLDEKLKGATAGFKENAALNQEFQAQVNTLANRYQLLQNKFFATGKVIGEKLKPALLALFDVLSRGLDFLANNPTLATFLAGLAAFAAIVGPLILSLGFFVGTILPALITGFSVLTAVVAGFSAVFAPIGVFLAGLSAPVWLAVAAVTGLVAVLWIFRDAIMEGLGKAWDFVTDKVKGFMELTGRAINGVKNLLGIETPAPSAPGNALVFAGGLTPQGAPAGAEAIQNQVNMEFLSRTNNARVDINVRAPQSTTIVSESEGGFVNINRGLVGAF